VTDPSENPMPEGLDDAAAEKVAVDAGIEAIRKIHAIERQMLNRAIHSLSEITGKSVQDVLEILADGVDTEYHGAVQQAQAAAKVAEATKSLYIPKPYLPN